MTNTPETSPRIALAETLEASGTPTVSVIVPNYNHARYLQKRIESVLGQTYQDFEVILLDDSSTDASREVLSAYANDPRVRMEFNEENSGSTFKQWNKGVRLARGKYVWIAESDDYADARLLERLLAILERQPEVTLAYCRSWRVRDNDTRDGYFDSYLDFLDRTRWEADFIVEGIKECTYSFLLCNTVPNASAVVFRTKVFESVGGADERLRISGDYKLWAGMALAGSMAFVAEPLNFFRQHEQNTHRTTPGLLPYVELLYVVKWILARVTGKQPQDAGADSVPPPAVTNSLEQFRECQALADELEVAISEMNPGRKQEIAHTFQHYRLSIEDREFAYFPPGHWRYFWHRCLLYGHQFGVASWKRRVLDLTHLIEVLIGGFQHRHWLGKKYAMVRKSLQTFATGKDEHGTGL
jgi:hypothetical protein